jgi:ABC-type transporter Mla subunit MlaD
MKKGNRANYIIALVVIASSVILLVALTLAMSNLTWFEKTRKVEIDFQSVVGIRPHSPVRYAGAAAGRVSLIRILSEDERRANPGSNVRVTLVLDEGVPPLRIDTKALIASDTVLSEKFVNLEPGSMDSPIAQEGYVFNAGRTIGLDDIMKVAYQAIGRLDSFLDEFLTKHPELGKNMADAISNGNKLIINANTAVTSVNSLVEANKSSIQVSLSNAKVMTTYAKSLLLTLADKPWRVIWGGETPKLPTEAEILKSEKPIIILPPGHK